VLFAAANDDIEKEEEEEPSAFAPQGADPDADTGLQRAFTLLEESAPEEPPEEKERRVLKWLKIASTLGYQCL